MFNELMEEAMSQDSSWIDKLLSSWSLPQGFSDFVTNINDGVNGVFDVIAMSFKFFLDVPALSLLLCFGMAFGSVRLLRQAFQYRI